MRLEVMIEKIDNDIEVPIGDVDTSMQFRSDGVLLNGKLHFWEEILMVHITNREVFDKIKKSRSV